MTRILWLRSTEFLYQGMYQKAERYLQESLQMCKRFGVRTDAAYAFAFLGHTAFARQEFTQARQHYEQSLARFEVIGQTWAVGRLHSHLGDVALAVEDYETAREHHLQALICYQDVGIHWKEQISPVGGSWGIPVSLQILGDIALELNADQNARQYYHQALEAAMGQPFVELHLHLLLGPVRLLARQENLAQAVELAALARHDPKSVEETRMKAKELLGKLRTRLPADVYTAAEQRGRARDLEATIQELLAELATDTDQETSGLGEYDHA